MAQSLRTSFGWVSQVEIAAILSSSLALARRKVTSLWRRTDLALAKLLFVNRQAREGLVFEDLWKSSGSWEVGEQQRGKKLRAASL